MQNRLTNSIQNKFNAVFTIGLIATSILAWSIGVRLGERVTYAQSSLSFIRQIDDHTFLLSKDGVEYAAHDLHRDKELLKSEVDANLYHAQLNLCEADLKATQKDLGLSRQNTQDERVRYSKLESLYGEQSSLLTECMKLSKTGKVASFFDKPVVRIGTEVVKLYGALKPCN